MGEAQPPEPGSAAWAVESLSRPLDDFLERVAAGTAAPGGGSTSALAGAMGAALLEMVANLTVGRERYAAVEPEIRGILDRTRERRAALRGLARQDIEAYSRVMEAYALPKTDAAERAARQQAVREALEEAIRVPLQVAAAGVGLLELALPLVEKGNRHAAGDGVAGARLVATAIDVALENVEINLALLGEREEVPLIREARQQRAALSEQRHTLIERIEQAMRARAGRQ